MSEETRVTRSTDERYTTVQFDTTTDTVPLAVELPVCLSCGAVVGVETLHDERCYGEEVNRRGEAVARSMWEDRVAAGEYDDE